MCKCTSNPVYVPLLTAGWTALMYASYVGHDTVVNLLLDAGADACKGTPSGLTPLMVAAGCGNESVCYFLIQVSYTYPHQCSQKTMLSACSEIAPRQLYAAVYWYIVMCSLFHPSSW